MSDLNIKPTHKPIKTYYAALEKYARQVIDTNDTKTSETTDEKRVPFNDGVQKHFLPNAYQKELAEERSRDPKTFGTGLVKDRMEGVRRGLRK